jgi:hypothetical protein
MHMAHQRERRSCEFCGRLGTTEEHILPKSWASLFGMDEPPPKGHSYWLAHHVREPVGDGPTTREVYRKRAKRPAMTTRTFCQPCQGGWMRRLDETVRSSVEALASLRETTLDPQQQATLAIWGIKTILAFYTKEPSERQSDFGATDLYRRFGEARQPLPGMHVWLGQRVRDDDGASFRSFAVTLQDDNGHAIPALGAVLAVRHLVIYMLGPVDSPRLRVRFRYESAVTLKSLFPATGRSWTFPRPLGIAPSDLTTFARFVGRDVSVTVR